MSILDVYGGVLFIFKRYLAWAIHLLLFNIIIWIILNYAMFTYHKIFQMTSYSKSLSIWSWLMLSLSMLIALPDNMSWRWLLGVNLIQTHHQLNQCHGLGGIDTKVKNDSLTIFTDNKKKTWQSTEQRSRLTSLLLKFMMSKMIKCAVFRDLWESSLDHGSKRITIGNNK